MMKFFVESNVIQYIGIKPSCGRSSVVEFQPSKLAVAGSNPVARSIGYKERRGVNKFPRLKSYKETRIRPM